MLRVCKAELENFLFQKSFIWNLTKLSYIQERVDYRRSHKETLKVMYSSVPFSENEKSNAKLYIPAEKIILCQLLRLDPADLDQFE